MEFFCGPFSEGVVVKFELWPVFELSYRRFIEWLPPKVDDRFVLLRKMDSRRFWAIFLDFETQGPNLVNGYLLVIAEALYYWDFIPRFFL